MKHTQKLLNIAAGILAVSVIAVVIWGCRHSAGPVHTQLPDGIESVDLDTIRLDASGVEVSFSDVILSRQNETRKLIVSTQTGTVTTRLTDRLIEQLDFDFMKKTQNVSYTGTGYFVVDLDNLTAANVTEDRRARTITIRIDHAYLQTIEIDPNKVIIDDAKKGLLTWGEIELTVADYNTIERDLRARLEEKFDTAANGQAADALAIRMVKEIYEPLVKAIDRRYSVVVQFR